MTVATWLAVAVLGPGALGIFVWFLADVRRILDGDRRPGKSSRGRS